MHRSIGVQALSGGRGLGEGNSKYEINISIKFQTKALQFLGKTLLRCLHREKFVDNLVYFELRIRWHFLKLPKNESFFISPHPTLSLWRGLILRTSKMCA
jgi:hypothetical protein